MPTIKGFTTNKDVLSQLGAQGITVKLPFTATNFEYTKALPEGVTLKDYNDNPFVATKVASITKEVTPEETPL